MEIKKLDTEIFDTIKTGIKTISDLTRPVQINFINKINKKFDKKGLLWIQDDVEKIINYIKDSDIKDSSKRVNYEALANSLLAIDKNKNKEHARKLFTMSLEIQTKINNNNKSQIIEKDSIKFQELTKQRNELFKNRNKGFKTHMLYLITAINTYLPPLRLDYTGKHAIQINGTENSITKKGKDYILKITKDKVSHRLGSVELNICKDHVSEFKKKKYINGSKICSILNQSLKLYPRKYIFSGLINKNKPMSATTYNNLLKEIFNKSVTQNQIRKAFINHYYKPIYKFNINDKEIISKYMRHSPTTAYNNYVKINY